MSLRYQLTRARAGRAFLIGNLQVVVPTGSTRSKWTAKRSGVRWRPRRGRASGASPPGVTAILPTDPAVLFGTLGYTRNFGKDVDTVIPPVRVIFVKPGDSLSASAGIGLSLSQHASLNLGYAHSCAFGTRTRTQLTSPGSADNPGVSEQEARDLQIGRLLFGVTYRVTDRASINWSVETGVTDDATDLRTVLRVPIILLTGGPN